MILGFLIMVVGYAIFYWGWHHFAGVRYSLWPLLGFGTLFMKGVPLLQGSEAQIGAAGPTPSPATSEGGGQPAPGGGQTTGPTGPQGRNQTIQPTAPTGLNAIGGAISSAVSGLKKIGQTVLPPPQTPTHGGTITPPPTFLPAPTFWQQVKTGVQTALGVSPA